MNHTLYIRRRGKVFIPIPEGSEPLPLGTATALSINLESLGYALSPALLESCRGLSSSQLGELQRSLIYAVKELVGADKEFSPMYLNFPQQVMDANAAELYFNALVHYWSNGRLFPTQRKKLRPRLQEPPLLSYIDLGSEEEFEGLFTQLTSSNVSFSEQDKLDIDWFVKSYGNDVGRLLSEIVPQKENAAYLSVSLLNHTDIGEPFVRQRLKTTTDVLRLAAAICGGDVSLAKPTRFGKFRRSQRRFILELLEERPNALEDMLRWKERWKRLGERLHPREAATRYPKTAEAFEVLRNDLPARTFNGRVERALMKADVPGALADLVTRPGDFARRLDHLLRLDPASRTQTITSFGEVVCRVSTPVLLQAWHHFSTRVNNFPIRTFFPKGKLAKAYTEPNRLLALPSHVSAHTASVLEEALMQRFSLLTPLGNTYVDPELRNYPIPFGTRSASKAFRTIPRGSRLSLPRTDVLRMFLWWRNGVGRTDIDLSAELMADEFVHLDTIAYYNLRNYAGCHSGDIVDAPSGASEFIDVSTSKLKELDVRYVAMVLTSYTPQPFVDLPECFAGWMARSTAESGEVYEPRTVRDRIDLAADTRVAIPIVFDLKEGVAVWCDMALRNRPTFNNHVAGNLRGISVTIRALLELNKPSIYDVLSLHARARGSLVDAVEGADTVFSVDSGTPFELDRIASEFMA